MRTALVGSDSLGSAVKSPPNRGPRADCRRGRSTPTPNWSVPYAARRKPDDRQMYLPVDPLELDVEPIT